MTLAARAHSVLSPDGFDQPINVDKTVRTCRIMISVSRQLLSEDFHNFGNLDQPEEKEKPDDAEVQDARQKPEKGHVDNESF